MDRCEFVARPALLNSSGGVSWRSGPGSGMGSFIAGAVQNITSNSAALD